MPISFPLFKVYLNTKFRPKFHRKHSNLTVTHDDSGHLKRMGYDSNIS